MWVLPSVIFSSSDINNFFLVPPANLCQISRLALPREVYVYFFTLNVTSWQPPCACCRGDKCNCAVFCWFGCFFLIWELFYWFLSLLYHSRELTEIPYMTEINPLSRAAAQRAGALWPPILESLLHVISPQQCHRSKGHYVDAIFCGELPAVQNHIGLCFFLAELQAPLCCTV